MPQKILKVFIYCSNKSTRTIFTNNSKYNNNNKMSNIINNNSKSNNNNNTNNNFIMDMSVLSQHRTLRKLRRAHAPLSNETSCKWLSVPTRG